MPNSKEFREALYVKRKQLESHLDQRRDLLGVVEKQMVESYDSLEEQTVELYGVAPDTKRPMLDSRFASIKGTMNKQEEIEAKYIQVKTEIRFFQVMLEEIDIGPLNKSNVVECLTLDPSHYRNLLVEQIQNRREIVTSIEIWIEQFGQNSPSKSEADDHESSDTGA